LAYFAVHGGGVFPFDMLRYEVCAPATEAHDSGAIDPMASGERGNDMRTVVLCKQLVRGQNRWRPTVGRWRSFTWCVVSDLHDNEADARRDAVDMVARGLCLGERGVEPMRNRGA
jgi:hypothetical protein